MRRLFFPLALTLLATLASPAPASAQLSDRDLAERISKSVLTYSKFSIFDDVNAIVDNRNVTLTGKVTTPVKKDELGQRVGRIDGVRSLTNEIGVLPFNQVDQRLRVVIASAIYNNQAFWRYAQLANPPIHIIVENQRVTLTGIVDSQVDRMLAYSLSLVEGTLSVENRLRVGR